MKLIEKKCPNCGASLEFNEKDTTCSCQYCHRSFEIERDKSNKDQGNENQYVLNEIVKTGAFFSLFHIIPFIIFIGIAFIIYNIYNYQVNENKEKFEKRVQEQKEIIKKNQETSNEDELDEDENELDENDDEDIERLLANTDEISSKILDALNTEATFNIKNAIGNNVKSSFNVEERKREKVYVAYKEGSKNYLIAIYKVLYKDFFNQSNIQTIYVPLVYENVRKNAIRLDNTTVSAPEYYFTDKKDTYAYGYKSFDEAYNDVIKPLESEYTITEK